MKRDTASHSKWDLESLAYVGALLGLLPASTHQIYSISIRDFHGDDPFTHMMVELIGGALGGCVLLCIIGLLLNKRLIEKHKATPKPEL
jgi:hypothetical protein